MVRHARLMLGESVIMIGSTRTEEEQFKSPSILGVYTQALCVYIFVSTFLILKVTINKP